MVEKGRKRAILLAVDESEVWRKQMALRLDTVAPMSGAETGKLTFVFGRILLHDTDDDTPPFGLCRRL